jgi:competence protein ComEC
MDKKRFGRFRSKLIKSLCAGVTVSLSATVFTTPLVAIHFGAVSLVSILTNLLTLWVITYIFYGIMLVCIVGAFHIGVAGWLAGTLSWLIRYVLGAADVMASLPLAAVYTKSDYIVAWLIFAYVLLCVYILLKEKPAVLFTGLVTIALCVSICLSWMEPMHDECRMTMLDVGQGQAILLQSNGKTFLVDCGGDYEEDAADIAAETLLSQGICRLDGIILTHYDLDHSGGLEYLLTRIDTDLILIPDIEDEYGVRDSLKRQYGDRAIVVADDTELAYDGVNIWLCAPFSYNSGNEGCICVLFQTENCDILITGDRGEVGEKLLLRSKELPQVDVLVVGHHGSKYSTSEKLLEAVRPTYAFISAGAGNRYGHPAQLILDRLAEYGCLIFRTDENGTIIYRG